MEVRLGSPCFILLVLRPSFATRADWDLPALSSNNTGYQAFLLRLFYDMCYHGMSNETIRFSIFKHLRML